MNGPKLSELTGIGLLVVAVGTGWFLSPSPDDWGLHIAILDVGQADAIVVMSSSGDACVIDAGHGSTAAGKIANFLTNQTKNGFAEVKQVKMGFVTHYDQDHVGGFKPLIEKGIGFKSIYDQGPSRKRAGESVYTGYLQAVGDPNDDYGASPVADDVEPQTFIRKRAQVGVTWNLGQAKIKCLSARGDTKGSSFDLALDPGAVEIDENPGSIALLITLGEFEFYSAGDQTSDDWKSKPDTEESVVKSGVIVGDNDIDVLKVNHHGSDTSSGSNFVHSLRPEVAVISTKHTGHALPKMVAIQQLVQNKTRIYITGDGLDPENDSFTDSSATPIDDGFQPDMKAIVNEAGDVHIFVAKDGTSYRVYANGEWADYSAVDSANPR